LEVKFCTDTIRHICNLGTAFKGKGRLPDIVVCFFQKNASRYMYAELVTGLLEKSQCFIAVETSPQLIYILQVF